LFLLIDIKDPPIIHLLSIISQILKKSLAKIKEAHILHGLYLSILFFMFIIFQVTRQTILYTFLVGLIYVFFKTRIKLYFVLLSILFYGLTFFVNTDWLTDNSIIRNLSEQTNDQITAHKQGEEDVRIRAYKYFFSDNISDNFLKNIFGCGIYQTGAIDIIKLGKAATLGYGTADVGYAAMYIYFGYFGLFIYILLFITTSLTKVPEEYGFAKLFMIFMIPANFGADWFVKADYSIIMCICVYLITK
jgi:hypothetical protein